VGSFVRHNVHSFRIWRIYRSPSISYHGRIESRMLQIRITR